MTEPLEFAARITSTLQALGCMVARYAEAWQAPTRGLRAEALIQVVDELARVSKDAAHIDRMAGTFHDAGSVELLEASASLHRAIADLARKVHADIDVALSITHDFGATVN